MQLRERVRVSRRWPAPAAALGRYAEVPVVAAVWLLLGYGLSRITTRVVDWFLMTDELLYERLAISIARGSSPLPELHGELVANFNQLYPFVLSLAFRGGLVPESLHDAHVLNAFVMTSALVPAYLLARHVVRRRAVALLVAVLSVCVPWIVLSSFLITEVVAYPAFVWALLGIQLATAEPRPRNDVLALLGIALAVSARTQFAVLLGVLPLAIGIHEVGLAGGRVRAGLRAALAGHRLLAGAVALAAVAAIGLAAAGRLSRTLGAYGVAAQGDLFPDRVWETFAWNLATIAVALGILPFLAAVAWMLATLTRRAAADRRHHAFAAVALVTLALLALQVSSFTLRFGQFRIQDRYLFYVVPLLLVGAGAVLVERRSPRWWLLAPAALLLAGLARHPLATFQKLNADTPAAVVHDRLLDLFESLDGARLGLALATVVLALLFAQAAVLAPRRPLAPALVVLLALALPLQTADAFSRLFAVDGTSGRPLTLDQGIVFNWIDRALGPDAGVTMVPYPTVPGDYWAGLAFWWDLEFWNVSVTHAAYQRDAFVGTPPTFPLLDLRFDPRTGAAGASPTRYAAQWIGDARFRLAGEVVATDRNTRVIDAGRSWRAEWVSDGLSNDGWTMPGRPATIRIFSTPGQRGPVTRYLGVYVSSAGGPRRVELASSDGRAELVVAQNTEVISVAACVPAGGFADVRLAAEGWSPAPPDQTNIGTFDRPREAGVFVKEVGLADETDEGC